MSGADSDGSAFPPPLPREREKERERETARESIHQDGTAADPVETVLLSLRIFLIVFCLFGFFLFFIFVFTFCGSH